MKYIYGPVRSRRLGLSLGITLTPHKICSFDCIYCQLGPTTDKSDKRKDYVPVPEVLSELKNWLTEHREEAEKLSYITFAGMGEPTLNLGIGQQTPPVASVLITACSIAKANVWEVSRVNIYFIAVLLLALMVVTYVPSIPMGLVHFFYR